MRLKNQEEHEESLLLETNIGKIIDDLNDFPLNGGVDKENLSVEEVEEREGGSEEEEEDDDDEVIDDDNDILSSEKLKGGKSSRSDSTSGYNSIGMVNDNEDEDDENDKVEGYHFVGELERNTLPSYALGNNRILRKKDVQVKRWCCILYLIDIKWSNCCDYDDDGCKNIVVNDVLHVSCVM